MRPVLSSLQTSILALSLGATGLVFAGACGDDEEPANNNNSWNPNDPNNPNNPGGGQDAGTGNNNQDAGNGGQSQCITVPGSNLAGVPCTTSTGEGGFQLCSSGVPSGECKTAAELIGSVFGDGGLGGLFGDAGFPFPDGGIPVPDGGLQCPDTYECSNLIGSLIGAIVPQFANFSICTEAGAITPPACDTPNASCSLGSAAGTCQMLPLIGNVCVIPCSI